MQCQGYEGAEFVALYSALELLKSGVGIGARTGGDEGVAVFDFLAQAGELVLSAMRLTCTNRFIAPHDESLAFIVHFGEGVSNNSGCKTLSLSSVRTCALVKAVMYFKPSSLRAASVQVAPL